MNSRSRRARVGLEPRFDSSVGIEPASARDSASGACLNQAVRATPNWPCVGAVRFAAHGSQCCGYGAADPARAGSTFRKQRQEAE